MSGGTRGKMTTTYSYVDSAAKARGRKRNFLSGQQEGHFGEDDKGIST